MSRFTFVKWVRTPDDKTGQEFLALLDQGEAAVQRMIAGIFWFFWEGIPQWLIPMWRKLMATLNRLLRLVVRIFHRLLRLATWLAIWFGIVATPAYILSSFALLATMWCVLAVLGSGYGLYRWRKTSRKVASEKTVTTLAAEPA